MNTLQKFTSIILSNELLFHPTKGAWLTPVIQGQRPPPCSDFALNGITEITAVLFGGYQHNGLQEQLYTIDFDPTNLVSISSPLCKSQVPT